MMNTKLLLLIACFIVLPAQVFAQIKTGQNVDNARSRYVVTDSAVFEYFVDGQALPYKVYDFSIRSVYVYFGNERDNLVSQNFSAMQESEVKYIREIGCDGAPLTSGFRRFC